MKVDLVGIRIRNFKSFKDQYISLKKFNVLVGSNSSGKTNFLEIFKFLKLAFDTSMPYNPAAHWWGYKNLTYYGDKESPISFDFFLEIEKVQVKYSISFGQEYGQFMLLREEMDINSIVNFEMTGNALKVAYNDEFIEKHFDSIREGFIKSFQKYDKRYFPENSIDKTDSDSKKIIDIINSFRDLNGFYSKQQSFFIFPFHRKIVRPKIFPRDSIRINLSDLSKSPPSISFSPDDIFALLKGHNNAKRLTDSNIKRRFRRPLIIIPYDIIVKVRIFLINIFSEPVLLRNINYKLVKEARFPTNQRTLNEDGSNLIDILYKWQIERSAKLPDIFDTTFERFFPGISINFSLFKDGQVYLFIKEKGHDLVPPLISEGLLKCLILLTAIELKPPILLIDEIENSLYANLIRYIISEFKELEDTIVIITTHSPMIVDMVQLDELLLVEKKDQTIMKRIKNIDKLKEKLNELEITNSDSWLYGDLYNFE